MLIKKHNDRAERIQLEVEDQIRLELLGFVTCPSGWKGNVHSHPFWELIYINKGQGIFYYEKKKYIFQSNNIYLLKPYKEHQFVNNGEEEIETLYVGFSFDFRPSKILKNNQSFPILQGVLEGDMIKGELREIANLVQKHKSDVLIKRRNQIIELLVKVINFLNSNDEFPVKAQNIRLNILVDKVKRYLSQNINRDICINEVAQPFYLSPHYLGDIFKQITGMSLKRYHNSLKMTKAAKLLKEGTLNISQIAEELGFETLHYFSRRFKKFYGVAPSYFHQT